jgi:chromosome partitioning protein
MTRVIAVALPKGGTGKTSSTLNLGVALAQRGQRVLLVDFDPQSNLSQSLCQPSETHEQNVYVAIKRYLQHYESNLAAGIIRTSAGVDLVPANELLNLANDELVLALERERVLQRLLEPISANYDFILIDTLPYLGVLTQNALVAASEVIIPLQAEYLATRSTRLMLDQVAVLARSRLNPSLRITGILLTMVDQRLLISREVIAYAREKLGAHAPIFETMIRRSVRFPESQAAHQSILQYDPTGPGAVGYRALAEEVLYGVKAQ